MYPNIAQPFEVLLSYLTLYVYQAVYSKVNLLWNTFEVMPRHVINVYCTLPCSRHHLCEEGSLPPEYKVCSLFLLSHSLHLFYRLPLSLSFLHSKNILFKISSDLNCYIELELYIAEGMRSMPGLTKLLCPFKISLSFSL